MKSPSRVTFSPTLMFPEEDESNTGSNSRRPSTVRPPAGEDGQASASQASLPGTDTFHLRPSHFSGGIDLDTASMKSIDSSDSAEYPGMNPVRIRVTAAECKPNGHAASKCPC